MDENNSLSVLTPEQAQMIPAIIKQMMGPLVEAMGKMLENNTQALNQLAAAQQVQADRLEALEKQIRLNTLVTAQQVKYMNDAIRRRAYELLDKRGISERKAITKLGSSIRKALLAYYGVGALHDIPKHEYSVSINLIRLWNDMLCVRAIVKEARERAEEAVENASVTEAEWVAHPDGEKALQGEAD